ncbi:TfpX/TfpZ family type IV pilin accessory protein [Dokdonella immobilis]|uniref:Type IV pilin accessory protein n=1 Tax=Dokdonella immobilis TaxID=578942 RepID=A0A1I4ZWA0_9GAMM|nr:TfpX/TfpZ family type IV pilin accessory protein [Dokdonella immobilis]SFN54515.1 hypothetical protein SAMN05216289_12961 [Dokdonella immobilis]
MSRWKAACIHLSISLLVGLLVLALLFLVWYPEPYFEAAGGQHLIVVLLGVDLVLGPLMTLILFKSGKWGMRFDLWMIGVVQSAALVYGLHVIAESRPVFIVAAVDRFNVMAPADIDPEDLAAGKKPEFRSFSWTGPRLVGAQIPPRGKERTKLMFQGPGGRDVQNYPKFYVDYEAVAPAILDRAKPLSNLRERNADAGPVLAKWLRSNHRKEEDVVWAPIMARKSSATMLLDAHTGEPLEAMAVYPW